MEDWQAYRQEMIRTTVREVEATGHPFARLVAETVPDGPLFAPYTALCRLEKETPRSPDGDYCGPNAALASFAILLRELTGNAMLRVMNRTGLTPRA